MKLHLELKIAQERIDLFLQNYFCADRNTDPIIKSATEYSIRNGGKRLRPFLVYATGTMFGANIQDLDAAAAAIECIHSYSLVHDDLPAMDNDDLRRGKPTCHIAYDEATAILAGDALQSLAYEILACHSFSVNAQQQIKMMQVLSKSSGLEGMVGGQALDISATAAPVTLLELERIHSLKTGAIICAAIELGALCAPNIDTKELQQLKAYGKAIGLAFQVQDDILDLVGKSEVLGKPQGSDIVNNKSTYPALLTMQGAKDKATSLIDNALEHLSHINADTEALELLAKYIIERDH